MVQRLQNTHREEMDNYHNSMKFIIIEPFSLLSFQVRGPSIPQSP